MPAQRRPPSVVQAPTTPLPPRAPVASRTAKAAKTTPGSPGSTPRPTQRGDDPAWSPADARIGRSDFVPSTAETPSIRRRRMPPLATQPKASRPPCATTTASKPARTLPARSSGASEENGTTAGERRAEARLAADLLGIPRNVDDPAGPALAEDTEPHAASIKPAIAIPRPTRTRHAARSMRFSLSRCSRENRSNSEDHPLPVLRGEGSPGTGCGTAPDRAIKQGGFSDSG